MSRLVLDTTIYVRGLMSPWGPWGRLLFDHTADHSLVLSLPLVREAIDVLTRPKLIGKYRILAGRDIQRVLGIMSAAEIVVPADIAPICRDPKDDVFLATALAGVVDYLVTEDRDLLVLGSYAGIRILDAAAFLQAIDA